MRWIKAVLQRATSSMPVGQSTLPRNGCINATASLRTIQATLYPSMSVGRRFGQEFQVNRGICHASHRPELGSGPVATETVNHSQSRLRFLPADAVLALWYSWEWMCGCHVWVLTTDGLSKQSVRKVASRVVAVVIYSKETIRKTVTVSGPFYNEKAQLLK